MKNKNCDLNELEFTPAYEPRRKKKKVLTIVSIIVIVSVVFSIYINDETRRIRWFIDLNNVGTVHDAPYLHRSMSGKTYKDVVFSNTKVMGIGYNDDELCLYSQDVGLAYIGYNGSTTWEYIEYCEIIFEWDEFGNRDFCAYVGYAPRSVPNAIKAVCRVYGYVDSTPPRFNNVEFYTADPYYRDEILCSAAKSSAIILMREACMFLRNQGLPSLY